MKSNIPSRIAFAVASQTDSRIILDTGGAEKLIGRGDMLYAPLGEGKPTRVQGCFISNEEIESVISEVKASATAEYDETILEHIDKLADQQESGSGSGAGASADGGEDEDEMFWDAVEVVMDCHQASVSMLQRRLKLGYSRAARIVDQMEERGIVGPFEGSKPRQILISRDEWQELKMRRNI
jgi:S-DNA-T family DNA segregation ATPase FtsK/SpoIIIE